MLVHCRAHLTGPSPFAVKPRPQWAAKALRKRIKSDNSKIVQLALTVTETCVKNCGFEFHAAIAVKEFMQDMINIADGKKGAEAADHVMIYELTARYALRGWRSG